MAKGSIHPDLLAGNRKGTRGAAANSGNLRQSAAMPHLDLKRRREHRYGFLGILAQLRRLLLVEVLAQPAGHLVGQLVASDVVIETVEKLRVAGTEGRGQGRVRGEEAKGGWGGQCQGRMRRGRPREDAKGRVMGG